jgi:Ca2+-binding RTX toxin-like protein
MADTPNVINSTSADETFVVYRVLNNPPTTMEGNPAPVTQWLNFASGFGQDLVQVDGATYSSPGGVMSLDPQPYVIKLGAGINPADLEVVGLADYYERPSYTRYSPGWVVQWELRVKETADRITVYDYQQQPEASHVAPTALLQIEFADGTIWSAAQVQALIDQSMAVVGSTGGTAGTYRNDSLIGLAGNDLLTPGQGNDQLDLRAGGIDTLQAWRGDGNDTVQGDLDVLRLRGGITRVDLQFSGANKVFVIEKGRPVYSVTADSLGRIELDDGTVLTAADIQLAAFEGSPDNDTLVGTAGNDLIHGQLGNDVLSGGLGHDTLVGGKGTNVLDGQAGDDLLVSAGYSDTLTGGLGADTFRLTRDASWTTIQDDINDGGADLIEIDAASAGAAWRFAGNDLFLSMANGSNQVVVRNHQSDLSSQTAIGKVRFSDGVEFTAAQIAQAATQTTNGNDFIEGSSGNDLINGGLGVDRLLGGAGLDTLIGGLGHDYLSGGKGNDVYRYSRGDGFDTVEVYDDGSADVIELGAGITVNDFVVVVPNVVLGTPTTSLDLILKDGQGGLRIYATSTTSTTAPSASALPTIKLADGTVFTGADLYKLRKPNVATTGADTLWADVGAANYDGSAVGSDLSGGKGNDVLNGNLGDDVLQGNEGSDTLRGGLGNDLLIGGKGNDTYLFNRGDGQDHISDNDTTWFNSDLLKVGGATSKQLWFTKSGDSLDISVIGTQDKVTIENWFLGSANKVEKITASDGKSLSAAKVQTLVNAMASFTPPADGVTTLPASTPTSVTKVIASSWA